MEKSPLLLGSLMGMLIAATSGFGAPAPAQRPPAPVNVVFMLVDDLGWTDLGYCGSDLYQTPHIDRLAKEGMRFTDAYSACTVCSPTRAAIMTGRYPAAIRCTDYIPGHRRPWARLQVPDWTMHMELEEYTLAEALHDAGYATGHFGKWHLGDEKYWPEHQGFDVNAGGWNKGQPARYFSPYENPRLADGPPGEYLTDRLANEACQFIQTNKDRPFFLNLWFYSVHTPLQAKPETVAAYQALVRPGAHHTNPTYAAMIEHTDDVVGKVLAQLDQLGLSDRTLVIFTSDNGGLLGAYAAAEKGHPRVTSNVPLRSGKGDMYEGGVRVPLIVKYPPRVKAAAVSHEPVISMDFYPTILEFTGVAGRPEQIARFDGVSLAPVLTGKKANLGRAALYWHYPHYHTEGAVPYSAIRQGPWRLVEVFEDNRLELYNLDTDIGEKENLAATRPDKVKELRADLDAWRKRVDAQFPTPNPNYDAGRAALFQSGN